MEITHGEMDKRQLDGIVARYNALIVRRSIPIGEAPHVLGAILADLQVFFVAFGLTPDPPPAIRCPELGGD